MQKMKEYKYIFREVPGDLVDIIYCEGHCNNPKREGEIYLGAAKEFCLIDEEEGDESYGYIVADCEIDFRDPDTSYKKALCEYEGLNPSEVKVEFIESARAYTEYTYRTA